MTRRLLALLPGHIGLRNVKLSLQGGFSTAVVVSKGKLSLLVDF